MFRFVVLTAFLACASAGLVPQLDGRIVGGSSTDISNYPYQISLRKIVDGKTTYICGGSIYKSNVIVTAAHCVYGYIGPISQFTIVAGTSSRTGAGTSRTISDIIIHPSYNSVTMNNDIALLKFETPLTLGAKIKAIPLSTSAPAPGTSVQATGWGTTSEGGLAASTLQVVTVQVVSNAQCGSNYGSGRITTAMICAGVSGRDSCLGDSGGPLVTGGRLVGIISWGNGCARPNYPGVYTNVANFNSWIQSNS